MKPPPLKIYEPPTDEEPRLSKLDLAVLACIALLVISLVSVAVEFLNH